MSTEKLGWEYLGILKRIPLGYQNISLLNKNTSKMKDYGGNTKQMSLWYQNMYLLIKNMRKMKSQGGNTWEY